MAPLSCSGAIRGHVPPTESSRLFFDVSARAQRLAEVIPDGFVFRLRVDVCVFRPIATRASVMATATARNSRANHRFLKKRSPLVNVRELPLTSRKNFLHRHGNALRGDAAFFGGDNKWSSSKCDHRLLRPRIPAWDR